MYLEIIKEIQTADLKLFFANTPILYKQIRKTIKMSVYSDDFILGHGNLNALIFYLHGMKLFFNKIRLKLSINKSFITHTTRFLKKSEQIICNKNNHRIFNQIGFNFLGFTCRHFYTKNYKQLYSMA